MKRNLFKRGMAGLLSLVMCLTALVGLGTTTAFAAGEQAEVYLISFPRSGDANLDYGGSWGHPNLQYMNGWYSGNSKYTTIRAMHSYEGNICYCIEPGTAQETGDRYTSKDETFWDNLPADFNSTISPYEMKLFIGRIMQYGYTGPISTSWRSQNSADAAALAEAMATQVLIWETIVGERDADFDHVSPGSYDAVKESVSAEHPLYSRFCSYYDSIVASVQRHSTVPSFMSKNAYRAQSVELAWDGTNYTATLTDSNRVLSDYSFSANEDGISFSVSGNKLTITAAKEDWLVDEPAADIVRKIYALCLDGRGPLQIAKQLEQEKVLIPSAYYASLGRKTRKQYTHPYAWDQKTVAGILANQQYTGCTVNFMTTTVSYKVHKTVYNPKDEWQIIPNTQPAIIDEDTWKRVQELRENRIRPTATGRTSLFSGKVFCADCGSKLHFCAAKSLNANQEHYRCANYKSGRGNCQIHYIRNVVLEKIVLEAINSLADFVRCYEPVFLYLMAQKDIVSKRTETNRLKSSIESGKRRIQDLDKLIERIYEDQVLGNISAERYARMSINYENEQRELVKRVDEDEKRLVSIEQTSLDLKTLLKVLRSSTAFEELTPTLVNSLIRRIEVHNNDKSSGHCSVKVDIYFTAIGLIDIPTEDEVKSLMEKIQSNPQEYRLTA